MGADFILRVWWVRPGESDVPYGGVVHGTRVIAMDSGDAEFIATEEMEAMAARGAQQHPSPWVEATLKTVRIDRTGWTACARAIEAWCGECKEFVPAEEIEDGECRACRGET